MKAVVLGGGLSGLAAAHRLESLLPEVEITLIERSERVGGALLTEQAGGFVIEGGPDSFLSRKERGVGLCEELGIAGELVGRKPENARSYVRRGSQLHPLPEGLTGMIPTDLDSLVASTLLSREGRERVAAEVDLPPEPPGGDESIASFVIRRLGREAYERLVEPLMTGIYGGDGAQLSLQATFPNLRALELEHGSVIRGLGAQPTASAGSHSPFVSLESGLQTLALRLAERLQRTHIRTSCAALGVRRGDRGYEVALDGEEQLAADGVVVAVPAFVAAQLFAELAPELAAAACGDSLRLHGDRHARLSNGRRRPSAGRLRLRRAACGRLRRARVQLDDEQVGRPCASEHGAAACVRRSVRGARCHHGHGRRARRARP